MPPFLAEQYRHSFDPYAISPRAAPLPERVLWLIWFMLAKHSFVLIEEVYYIFVYTLKLDIANLGEAPHPSSHWNM